jgi:hypothetical protein
MGSKATANPAAAPSATETLVGGPYGGLTATLRGPAALAKPDGQTYAWTVADGEWRVVYVRAGDGGPLEFNRVEKAKR